MTNLARIIQMARDGEAISPKSMRDAIVALADENKRLTLLNDEKYNLLLRMKDEVDEFSRLIGIDPGTKTIEEQAREFNSILSKAKGVMSLIGEGSE
ncbi:hypothetical protein [Cohnella nanjingensis]|uniref:Uncharacterized protein n=1 Tax=Cohnella nanjingensis TaxID=1387779 RepID=A0A7X0RV06_9BACL|nr:hypothetical protein [Cohnella nanjingensis]MBB6672604.1 hypothetical protein [Cohnella nanjingensis]